MIESPAMRIEIKKAMPNSQHQPRSKPPGEVRIRSNVCSDPNAWHLVPGDLLESLSLHHRHLTPMQRSEMMYYKRCCLCGRTSFEIDEDGCDYCAESGHGTLSVAEARRRRQQRHPE